MTTTAPAIAVGKVLVVEDDPSSRAALQLLVRHCGYQVEAVATVKDAVDKLGWGPECVVLDLMLPDGTGVAVMREIRARDLPVRVAVLTGANDPDLLREATAYLPAALLRKPVDWTQLRAFLGACTR